MTFGAAEWNIFRYDFLHPSFYGRYVFQLNGTPDAEQNEADYLKAYYFVEETKVAEAEEETEGQEPVKN